MNRTARREYMSRCKISPIGQVFLDLIEEWQIANDSDYVQKPISYALYHVWKKWDEKEKPKVKEQTRAENNS